MSERADAAAESSAESDALQEQLGRMALAALAGEDVSAELASLSHELASRFRVWFALEPSRDARAFRPAARFGAYELLAVLGQGGQAVVYLAEDARLGRRVALKVLQGNEGLSGEALARFRREAEAAARVDHPGICLVYEAGEVDGTPYMAMRHAAGGTLAQRIQASRGEGHCVLRLARGAPSPAGSAALRADTLRALELVEALARALHAAHERGLVHRDIKPANVLLDEADRPLLADFGLARDLARTGAALTQVGALLGTPHYMSPEQLRGAQLDRRSDVFALGVVLYECLTLERPFDGPTAVALYRAISVREPSDPRKHNRAISADLRTVVETALQKDRDGRYLSAAALADDLRAVLEQRPIRTRSISRASRALRWTRREPWKAALAAALLFLLPAVFGVAAYAQEARDEAQLSRAHELQRRVDDHLDEGYFKILNGDLEGARSELESALRADPARPPVLALAGLGYLEGEPARVLRYVEGYAEDLAGDPDFNALHATVLALNGNLAGWQRMMDAPQARSSAIGHFLTGYRHLADAAYDHATLRRAEEEFRLAVRKAPRPFHSAVVLWGRAAAGINDRTSVELSARLLGDLWGERLQTSAEIARMFEEIAEHERARDAAERVLAEEPDNYVALEVLMLAAFHELADGERRLAECEQLALHLLELHPWAALPPYMLGRVQFARGQWEAARATWRTREQPPGEQGYLRFALVSIAESLHCEARADEALAAMQEAAAAFPRFGWALRGLAALHLERGELDLALARIDEALGIDAASAGGHYLRGRILLAKGDRAAALAEWEQARRMAPDFASGAPFVDAQHEGGDTLPGARAALELGCELFPGDARAHQAVADFLLHPFPIELPGDRARALAAAQEAARLLPEPGVLATLARASRAAGDLDGACAVAERALAGARPGDPWRAPLESDLAAWRAEARDR